MPRTSKPIAVLKETKGSRIRATRIERGLTQDQLAECAGVSKQAIYKYENNIVTNIPDEKLEAIAKRLGVTPGYLLGWDASAGPVPGAVPVDLNSPQIPLLGCVRCGMPLYAESNIDGYVPFRGLNGEDYFALRADGDSMDAAGIHAGDTLIIRQQDIVEDNEIAVICVNGDEATLKRYHREGDTIVLTPQSYNPAHRPQVYDLRHTPVHIVGRLMEVRHTY
jgi:repressor LexA